MKGELKGKYMSPYYYDHLLDKWRQITQDNKSAEKYVTKFVEYLTCYKILGIESDIQFFSQFKAGLRVDLEDSCGIVESLSLKRLMFWSKI